MKKKRDLVANSKLNRFRKSVFNTIRKVSLYKRLMILFVILVVLIFTSMFALVIQSVNDYRENVSFESATIISNYSNSLTRSIDTLDSVTKFQIIQNANNSSGIYSKLLNDPGIWDNKYFANMKYLEELKPLFDIDQNIYMISILDREATHFYCFRDAKVFRTFKDNADALYLTNAAAEMGAMTVLNSRDLDSPLLTLPDNSICGVRAIVALFPRRSIGTALCVVNAADTVQNYELSKTFPDEEIAFYDKNNNVIMGSLSSDTATLIRAQEETGRNRLNNCVLKDGDIKYLYYYAYSSNNTLCVVRIPYNEIVSAIIHENHLAFLFLLISFIIVIILVQLLMYSIRVPIETLSVACQNVRDEKFGFILEDDAQDEMHDLMMSFNEMSERIAFLIDEVYRKETLQSKNELEMLRAQINPHFMYNTLETIRSRAIINHDDEIVEMVTLFGQLLRYGVSNSSALVTTEEVQDYLNNYVRLQQLHYKQNCFINITFDPELSGCKMLKLLIQPLLENAIYHGIYDSNRICMIDIMGYPEFDCMVFKVSDNGQGVPPEVVKDINDYINDKNSKFTSIGLRNVNRRIKLYYGEEYGITFESKENYGSVVTVTIPKEPV